MIGPGMRRDGTGRFWDAQGNPLHDLLAVSTFSEYTVIDMSQLAKVDPALPPKLGCLISCGGATGEPANRAYIYSCLVFSTPSEGE